MERYGAQPLDLMQFINTKYHEPFIHERLELDGALDETRLTAALDTLIGAFPILKCRYDAEENAFFEVEHRTGKDLLQTEASARGEELLTQSLDWRERLIQFTISGSTLYITVSHLVCDGSGFKQLLYALCDSYNGKLDAGKTDFMKRGFSQLMQDGNRRGTLAMLLSMMGGYQNRPIYAKAEAECPFVAEQTLPKAVMDKIHALAKGQGATLNDVFLTAYARTLARQIRQRKINLPCTVDLRKYAKEATGIANLTGTYQLNVKLSADEEFRESLTRVRDKMCRQKATRNDIAGPALLVSKYEKSTLEGFLKLYGGMTTSAYTDYTNLGVLDEGRLCFGETTVKSAVGYSGLSHAPCFQIAVSTFRGETTVSSLFRCARSEREKADAVVTGIAAELLAFAETSK